MSQRRNNNENTKNILENDNKNITYPNFWDATKALLKEDVLLQMYEYICQKTKQLKISVLSIHFKKLEVELKNKIQSKSNKIRAQKNEIENQINNGQNEANYKSVI